MRGRAGVGQSRSPTDVRKKNHTPECRTLVFIGLRVRGRGGAGLEEEEEQRLKVVAGKKGEVIFIYGCVT